MKAMRSSVTEILEKRTRTLKRVDRYMQLCERHDQLLEAVDWLAKHMRSAASTRRELLRYIPVGLVACLEGYFRMLIRDLVDAGGHFRENAEKLEVSSKFDLPVLLAIGGQKVTVGELVAHHVRINSLEDINKHMSILTGFDFMEGLQRIRDPDTTLPFGVLAGRTYASLRDTFTFRHITCHELAPRHLASLATVRKAAWASYDFTYFTELCVQEMLMTEREWEEHFHSLMDRVADVNAKLDAQEARRLRRQQARQAKDNGGGH